MRSILRKLFGSSSDSSQSNEKPNFDMEKYISAALDGAIKQNQSHDNTWGFSEANEWHVVLRN
ncbi:hypothetical protein C1E23_18455 [Pseudoalteromonas phenolica]|uniref:Uncharacterized protein n=1 Tax=Pseudoalteromonas phenolica TaxID=161398 RepID=A0A4Q7IJA1_9GAMM|nr:hypothetical protein [Pseudoalteromonas phenolica]RZQ51622.1 hypothetical protein C1E23_18455 [Pseudoalteromonas phenolica]